MKTKQNKETNQGSSSIPSSAKTAEPSAAPALDSQKPTTPPAWQGVFFQGPHSTPDPRSGDEIPTWTVFVGDEDGAPTGKVYTVFTFSRAQSLAQAMSHDRRLELIAEAQPAATTAPALAAAA